jgi:2-dehydro-3-deoxyphosphogluconate aldolase / (4S)-4-hydroxy-2-oxoglutarate aldolase
MTGDSVLDQLVDHRLVPVIVLDHAEAARLLGDALLAGGLPVAEITLRTPSAMAVLEAMAENASLLVGAGTVLDVDQVEQAVAVGARFIVSPGFDADVVRRAQELGAVPIPGIATATELQAARRAGLDVVKFFPARALGGVPALRALAAPFPEVRFVPTGGIDAKDLVGYLEVPSVVAVGGSFMVPSAPLADKDWEEITQRVREAVLLARGEGQADGTAPTSGGSR